MKNLSNSSSDPRPALMVQPGLDSELLRGPQCPADCTSAGVEVGEGSSGQTSSSPESGSLNGEVQRPPGGGGGRRRQRRRRRSPRVGPSLALQGLRAERVWFEQRAFEQAESGYHRRLAQLYNGRGFGVAAGTTVPTENPTVSESDAPPAPAGNDRPLTPHCSHGEQVACHHRVHAVWLNKPAFDAAESRFQERATAAAAPPASLALPPPRPPAQPATERTTPDEGYLTLTPTPTTPSPQRPVNGLPPPAVAALLRGVWLEKPQYDQAEQHYHQSLCSADPCPTTRGSKRARRRQRGSQGREEDAEEQRGPESGSGSSLDAEIEGERDEPLPEAAELVGAPPQEQALAEEEERWGGPSYPELAGRFPLHPDSERVWLDGPRFHQAERRLEEMATAQLASGLGGSNCPPPATTAPCPGHCTPPQARNTMSSQYLAQEKIWFDKCRFDDAERQYYERMNGPMKCCSAAPSQTSQETGANTILQDIARARENIQKSLAGSAACPAGDATELLTRMSSLELENQSLHKVVEDLRLALSKLESRVMMLERTPAGGATAACVKAAPVPQQSRAAPPAVEEEEDDDDLDLFGSDEEDDEAARVREERVKAYAEKKAKKPVLIAKSSILLDVKPWDDETDMAKLEQCVRSVQADGLLWGSSKLVPVGYGIRKLQIQCVVEDDKVGTDLLEEEITKFEDYVQSVDVAAFNKI
ncbi:eukaryotic translation elongation factor 1 delta b (guanine nucleotide exchange protein) isoform X2 [Amia ocellicauda]|uniref:eukaryotic translation elongation factor 1 delta b (guanine nucleotide exchange protein) isoform X2 n=1 Tax=Amia ocellicauda TaxID=2972642 RepID=UPI00346488CF